MRKLSLERIMKIILREVIMGTKMKTEKLMDHFNGRTYKMIGHSKLNGKHTAEGNGNKKYD